MGSNTKAKGNKAESVILSEFIKNNIPTLLPFGDNEKYDLVIELDGQFKSVQVKYGSFKNGAICVDLRHRIGVKRIKYETYFGKVDLIAIWCEELDQSFLLTSDVFGKKTKMKLRVTNPQINVPLNNIMWAENYRFEKIISRVDQLIQQVS